MRRSYHEKTLVSRVGLGVLSHCWQGIVLVVLILTFCIQVFLAVDRHSHSVSDTFYGIFPYVVPRLLVLNWIPRDAQRDALSAEMASQARSTLPLFSGQESEIPLPYGIRRAI